MNVRTKILISAICLAFIANSCGGGGSKTIRNDTLHPFLFGGIYMVNGYGGSDVFFELFAEGLDSRPGSQSFLSDLEEGYEMLFIYPYKNDRSGARRELSNSWDINSKEDFLEMAEFLLTEGHQKAYEFCRKVLDEYGGEQADLSQIDLTKYASEYEGRLGRRQNIQFVKDNYAKFSPSGIKAWDIARYVNNVNMAQSAGYVTDDEGYQLLAKARTEAQKLYQDWDEYWSDFNLGRYFWGGDDDPSFTKIANALTDKNNSYNIYNYMPLK